MAMSELQ